MEQRDESWRDLILRHLRLITFTDRGDDPLRLDRRMLAIGLVWTWIVGVGRWWDDPGARLLQHLGLGSVIYVFVLAAVVWAVIRPMRPANWTYERVLTFITLTSPPAILYAIPVERLYGLRVAATMNLWFLGVVALWRVSLMMRFVLRTTRLTPGMTFTGVSLPICVTVVTLTLLNLERAVINIMGGLGDETAADQTYFALIGVTILCFYASWALVPIYLVQVYFAQQGRPLLPDQRRTGTASNQES